MGAIDELALECINFSRPLNQQELWNRYEKLCNRRNVTPLVGQLKQALKRLWKSGQIRLTEEGVTKVRPK